MKTKVSLWIIRNRKKVGISQVQLADKLGVSQPQISYWETGSGVPSYDVLQRLSTIFKVDLDEKTLGVSPPLGEWLRKKREKLELTREELAEKAGISALTIYFIENGKTESPQQATISGLEKALGKLPSNLSMEVEKERAFEDLEFLGPFPVDEWKEIVKEPKLPAIYVFYDQVKRPVRIGETEDLRRRLNEYAQNYWWFRPPTVETFAYVAVNDAKFRRRAEKVMIKLVGEHAIFNTQEKI